MTHQLNQIGKGLEPPPDHQCCETEEDTDYIRCNEDQQDPNNLSAATQQTQQCSSPQKLQWAIMR